MRRLLFEEGSNLAHRSALGRRASRGELANAALQRGKTMNASASARDHPPRGRSCARGPPLPRGRSTRSPVSPGRRARPGRRLRAGGRAGRVRCCPRGRDRAPRGSADVPRSLASPPPRCSPPRPESRRPPDCRAGTCEWPRRPPQPGSGAGHPHPKKGPRARISPPVSERSGGALASGDVSHRDAARLGAAAGSATTDPRHPGHDRWLPEAGAPYGLPRRRYSLARGAIASRLPGTARRV
jgi:hypothetical protein